MGTYRAAGAARREALALDVPGWWGGVRLLFKSLLVGLLVAVVCPLLIFGYNHYSYFKGLPNFQRYDDVSERKDAFIRFMLPIVQQVNSDIRRQQRQLIRVYTVYAAGQPVNENDARWLAGLAVQYDVKDFSLDASVPEEQRNYAWQLLFRRVDTIPLSLMLAQAANESAWGTSRFAREGHNLFGEWCFEEGCGMVPLRRDPNKTHEVKNFDRVYDSVFSYAHNLNTADSYAKFRDMRMEARRKGEALNGMTLVSGLSKYSELGKRYVEIIRSVIEQNALQQFDNIQPQSAENGHSKLSS